MIKFIRNFLRKLQELLTPSKIKSNSGNLTQDDLFNAQRKLKEEKLNRILDKISKKGLNSLSKKEKEFLDKNAR